MFDTLKIHIFSSDMFVELFTAPGNSSSHAQESSTNRMALLHILFEESSSQCVNDNTDP